MIFNALTSYRGGIPEPLNETTAVLAYEVGRMLEYSMYMKWQPENADAWRGFYKSELMDAMAQLTIICESLDTNFEEMKELGIEKAMERFTGKEVK